MTMSNASFEAVGTRRAIPAIVNSTVLCSPVASGTRIRIPSPGTPVVLGGLGRHERTGRATSDRAAACGGAEQAGR